MLKILKIDDLYGLNIFAIDVKIDIFLLFSILRPAFLFYLYFRLLLMTLAYVFKFVHNQKA